MTTAHLAAKPLLIFIYIYWSCGPPAHGWPHCNHWPHSSFTTIGRIRALHSLAAFEPYIHWPHPSPKRGQLSSGTGPKLQTLAQRDGTQAVASLQVRYKVYKCNFRTPVRSSPNLCYKSIQLLTQYNLTYLFLCITPTNTTGSIRF